MNATVMMKGRIPAHGIPYDGHVLLTLWEYEYSSPVFQDDTLYFQCDPHGCYANKPISLFLGKLVAFEQEFFACTVVPRS